MEESLSLVKFTFMNFWAVVISTRPMQPTSTLMVKLIEALISSEPEPDLTNKKRVRWIYENTNESIHMPLSIVELAVYKNIDKGLNCEIDLGERTFYLIELYNMLDNISKELSNIAIDIAKKYSLDIPMMNVGKGTQSISLDDIGK